jgi:hypothetical protein
MTAELLRLSHWILTWGCTHVAIESTGDYWRSVFNIAEGTCEVVLVNAQHVKAVPGRKPDINGSTRRDPQPSHASGARRRCVPNVSPGHALDDAGMPNGVEVLCTWPLFLDGIPAAIVFE